MTVIAAANTHTLWWVTLGMGLVVILVVIVLMMMLLSLIKDIERGSGVLLDTADQVAENTSSIPMFAATAALLEDIKAEALIHFEYLQSQVRG